MTNRINEIRRRAENATPGLWEYWHGCVGVYAVNGEWQFDICECDDLITANVVANGAFIANARQDIPYLLDQLAERDREIERLREAQRWIPVSEKPRRTQNCLCLFNDGSMAIAWYNGIPYEFHPDITHWMPLPAAPEEGE